MVAAAAAAAGRLARGGYTVVFDGVIGPWFLPAFLVATGLSEVDYVMLLPPAPICLGRVRSRVGHGFADLDATRHMYDEFARAASSELCVVRAAEPPESLATTITGLRQRGALRMHW